MWHEQQTNSLIMQVFIPPTGRTLALEQQTKSTIDDAFLQMNHNMEQFAQK